MLNTHIRSYVQMLYHSFGYLITIAFKECTNRYAYYRHNWLECMLIVHLAMKLHMIIYQFKVQISFSNLGHKSEWLNMI